MFLRNQTKPPIGVSSVQIDRLKEGIKNADAVVIGAGAGLSTSAGFTYSGERFDAHFRDFGKKYGFRDMYTGGFYPYNTPEEHWAYWSRFIYYNRNEITPKTVYQDLLQLVKDKDYFVLTTNVDHQFQMSGFDKHRLFYTQGDYGLFQCSVPCHQKTYENEEVIRRMVMKQKDMRIPTDMIPMCPICGKPITMNLCSDDHFVEDEGWHKGAYRYNEFIRRHQNMCILFWEMGVGYNTPIIIKYPFWQMTARNHKAIYACLNFGESICPQEIAQQSICINADIGAVLSIVIKGTSP
ncbi:Sir2 silent information regulator family NAD-dependent deacetylase [Desulfosporosinus sp. BG]|uniref:SIR2 family NAD-dependent protein deacylase n=1 Tax=Desulfosporosinus sp. BG TaxID=1633135 RepID=UPI000839E88B|nr:Sir2 silent information regulator family NAD-dependent deacetylase [Desulfosporosinus sp. BG]ODA43024.1 NAD-dependent protein deacetylase of SIR2 family [Desulfosporosinus sp. BG]